MILLKARQDRLKQLALCVMSSAFDAADFFVFHYPPPNFSFVSKKLLRDCDIF
jgi:hypothetical protein